MQYERRTYGPKLAIWIEAVRFAIVGFAISMLAAFPVKADPAQSGNAADEIVILALGDSLTAGYQLSPGKSFPAQLQKALREKGQNVRIINAGVSGDTTVDGLARLDWSLTDDVDAAIVELGANDGLRGFDPEVTEKALDQILVKLKERGLPVLLAGMEAPRNWGPDYTKSFASIFPRLAEKHGALLYPFFLQDVATKPELNLPDGLHPKPEGVAVIVKNIMPEIENLIARTKAANGAPGESG